MEPELEELVIEPTENDGIAAVADLYVANLDVRDEKLLRRAYDQIIDLVPDQFKDLYAEAAGLRKPDR